VAADHLVIDLHLQDFGLALPLDIMRVAVTAVADIAVVGEVEEVHLVDQAMPAQVVAN
tara:strand:- start:120 stop:293 length:174 start_codon:yes stop_codon:yes gene_type:complete